MFKPLAVAVGLGCAALSLGTNAYQCGEYTGEALECLIAGYPDRYRSAASSTDANELIQSHLDFGYQTSCRGFTWVGSRSSQNVVASAPDGSGKFLVLSTHYGTHYGHPTPQGLDDNVSDAAVLTEIAHNFGDTALENGLGMAGFDAEEEGLYGSHAYVESLDASQHANLLGMTSLDSLVIGDKMYTHIGSSSVSNSALGAYREQTLHAVHKLDIPPFTSPGLNAEYPAGTGYCSDGESLNEIDTPVLFAEATDRELGDLDSYEQTDDPAVPSGPAWYDPAKDNKEILTNTSDQEHIEQRMRDFSRLLTRLVLELTNADLLASTTFGDALAWQMEDQLQHQHQALTCLHDRRRLTLLGSNRPAGSFDGEVGAEGEVSSDSDSDMPGDPESRHADVHLLGDYHYSETLTLGSSLVFQRNCDKPGHGKHIKSDTWQFDLLGLYSDGGPEWLAGEPDLGHTRYDSKRLVYLQAAGGSVLFDQCLLGDISAWPWGAWLEGGYDFSFGELRNGSPAGLDYMRCRIDGFREDEALRTTFGCEKQDYDPSEASLDWRLRGKLALGARIRLQPYASLCWVCELADGRLEDVDPTSRGGERARVADVGDVDKDFGRVQLGAQLATTKQLGVLAGANSRFAHNEGNQAGYSLGVNWQF